MHALHLDRFIELAGHRPWNGQVEWFYVLRVDAFEPHGSMSAEELATENVTGMT